MLRLFGIQNLARLGWQKTRKLAGRLRVRQDQNKDLFERRASSSKKALSSYTKLLPSHAVLH